MDEQDRSMFQIPVDRAVLAAQEAAIAELDITPATPVVFQRAFPDVSQKAQDLEVYNELSAVSDEVIACRNSILSNIY
ncbi:MAG: hypothetical protein Q4D22_04055 [Candidatus Saccharibacteria bacterium]|jgi:hypothetical protein|nr:hypothetical protein [Candidatus Saccharibacteria bacterium]